MSSDSGQKPAGPKKKRKGRRPKPRITLEERAERALSQLRALGRELGQREGVLPNEPFPVDEVVIPVKVAFTGGSEGEDEQELVERFRSHVREALTAKIAFRPGRVYCFQCGDAGCAHTAPGQSADTFAGYSPTGKPVWITLTNLLINRGDPRVDKLYGDEAEVVAVAQTARELTGELMAGFGRGSLAFKVLGQVAAGLVPPTLWPAKEERFTLTLQIVETRVGKAKKRLRLNIIGLSLDDVFGAAQTSGRLPAERLRRVVRDTRQHLVALGRRVTQAERRGATVDLRTEVEQLISRLANELERIFRPPRRRTQHAYKRHVGGERPTSSALRDARNAPDDRLLHDAERDTIVVLGPRRRAHLFSREGKHVTSLQLRPGEVERKSARKRWRPLSPEQLRDWRGNLEGD